MAAVQIQGQLNKNVVTVFPDDLKKYLSTDLNKNVEIRSKFISKDIKLIGFEEV